MRERLPDHEPYRAWSNFEFLADDGSINEVDLLVLTPKGFYLVEIKSRPGIVEGDQGTWTWRHNGRTQTVDNPLPLANRKAKKLIALLRLRPREALGAPRPLAAAWEHIWALQRREDAVDARAELPASDPEHRTADAVTALKAAEIGTIPVPPRYKSADFRKGVWWRLRGKLDVPKERFVSRPGCERDADPSLVIGWAGWDALQQSQAVAAYLLQMREQDGWTAERLAPLLTALLELLPWVRQYHNAPDLEFGTGMGDYFEGFIDEEARALSLTRETIRAWTPPAVESGRGRRKLTQRRRQAKREA